MKNDPLEFSLVCLDSLNMKYIEFSFIGLVILKIEMPFFGNEPLLYQVRKMYENGLVFRRAKMSVCYPLWTHKNEKRKSINHDEEIKGRESFCK